MCICFELQRASIKLAKNLTDIIFMYIVNPEYRRSMTPLIFPLYKLASKNSKKCSFEEQSFRIWRKDKVIVTNSL